MRNTEKYVCSLYYLTDIILTSDTYGYLLLTCEIAPESDDAITVVLVLVHDFPSLEYLNEIEYLFIVQFSFW